MLQQEFHHVDAFKLGRLVKKGLSFKIGVFPRAGTPILYVIQHVDATQTTEDVKDVVARLDVGGVAPLEVGLREEGGGQGAKVLEAILVDGRVQRTVGGGHNQRAR